MVRVYPLVRPYSDDRFSVQALSAILRRKRLVFESPQWKLIPWREISKDLKDILVDTLVDMPGLVQDFDEIKLCPDTNRQQVLRQQLEDRCWEYDRQLLGWLAKLQEILGPLQRPPSGGPRDIVTHIAQVHGMSLFWTTSLVLYSILHAVSESDDSLPERTDPVKYARCLVDAISTLLQPSAGLYGTQSAVLLLEIALSFIPIINSMGNSIQPLLNTLTGLKHNWVNGLVYAGNNEATSGGPTPRPVPHPVPPCGH